VLTFKYRFLSIKSICACLLLIGLSLGLVSCSDRIEVAQIESIEKPTVSINVGKLSEVAPPILIEQLNQSLEQYQPQVAIISPQSDRTFQETTVDVQIQVRDLPIFKDPDLEMGPHLMLILDNETAQEIYNIDNPITLENLTPGTHTLRVFATRPWHESFKNEGAYAQTTFHILAKTGSNTPDPTLPLLTYGRPQGSYGAEPILLDFYLTNAPLHLVAQENDPVADWRIRVTINGQSFVLDNWQPVYLTGFEKGNNWVQLEFINERGDRVDNVFNNTVRLIEYNPKGQDTLSQLMRGELAMESARSIVDATYKAKLMPVPEEKETTTVETEVPVEQPSSIPEETTTVETEIPVEQPSSIPEETTTVETEIPVEQPSSIPEETTTVETEIPAEQPSSIPEETTTVETEIPVEQPSSIPEETTAPELEITSEPTIEPSETALPKTTIPETSEIQAKEAIAPRVEETSAVELTAVTSPQEEPVTVASPVVPEEVQSNTESMPVLETPPKVKNPY
jgi:hypothetical protein